MKKYLSALYPALLSALLIAPVSAKAEPDVQALTATCMACHGETGNSMSAMFPNIAGQNQQYLLKQLKDIQSGERQIPTMMGLLDNMSEEDLAAIAAHYAKQERAYGAADPELVELGEQIYRAGIPRKNVAACIACHSPSGQGNGPAKFPSLAGQWPDYTVAQLKAYQTGERHNDGETQMMRTTALDLNEREMRAVATYLYGLR